jgi:hypothetical protein
MPRKNAKTWAVAAIMVCMILAFGVVLSEITVPVPGPPPYVRQILNRFPVSLDRLFWMDNTTKRNMIVNSIKTGQTEDSAPFIVPYPNYFHAAHSPAAFKWYLYAFRPLAISFPIDSYFNLYQDRGNSTETINGTVIKVDLHVEFAVAYSISIILDHVCVNQSLFNAWQAAPLSYVWGFFGKFVHVPANATIGYTHNSTALDFYVSDTFVLNYGTATDYSGVLHEANPFFYFTQAVQDDIIAHYQTQYDAMKQSGLYVESGMNRTYDINEANSLFGTWFYHAGYFNLNSSHHTMGWYSFDGAILNILNVNKTSRDTFFKDKGLGSNFNSSMIGVFYDAHYVAVQNYGRHGGVYAYLKQGDLTQGIICFNSFFDTGSSSQMYIRYSLIPSGSSMYGDLLRVDYFNSLSSAQAGFTANNLTYIRLYEHT